MSMDRDFFLKNYWKYFLQLENEFYATEKYVAFSKHNDRTCSMEYLLIYQAVCSEIDTLGKAIVKYHDPSFKIDYKTSLKIWGYEYQKYYPDIENTKVVFNSTSYYIPWKNWKYQIKQGKKRGNLALCAGKKTPKWWLDYNAVKHSRAFDIGGDNTNFILANQKNVIFSMSALYAMEVLFMKNLGLSGYDRPVPKEGELFSLMY